mgnify:FL=1
METKYIVHVLYNTPFFTSTLYITLGITIFYSIIDPTLPTLKILHLYSQQMYLQKKLGCVDPIVYVYFISVNIEMQLHHNPIPSAVICLLSNCYTRWSEKFGHPWHQCCTHLRWEYFVFVSFRYRCLTRLGLFWAIPSLSSSYSSSAGGWEAFLGLAFLFLGRLVSVLVFGPMSWNWNEMTIHRKHIKYWSEWYDNRSVKGAFHAVGADSKDVRTSQQRGIQELCHYVTWGTRLSISSTVAVKDKTRHPAIGQDECPVI